MRQNRTYQHPDLTECHAPWVLIPSENSVRTGARPINLVDQNRGGSRKRQESRPQVDREQLEATVRDLDYVHRLEWFRVDLNEPHRYTRVAREREQIYCEQSWSRHIHSDLLYV